MRVAGDQRFVVRKRHSWNIFEQVVTVAYQISLETNCVELSYLITLHDWGPATFFRKQLTALDMVLNMPRSHKLSTYYYNTEVGKDPNDYRSSSPEVFCKKVVFRNFAKFTGNYLCQSLFFKRSLILCWISGKKLVNSGADGKISAASNNCPLTCLETTIFSYSETKKFQNAWEFL